jgi:hypothetical protein
MRGITTGRMSDSTLMPSIATAEMSIVRASYFLAGSEIMTISDSID